MNIYIWDIYIVYYSISMYMYACDNISRNRSIEIVQLNIYTYTSLVNNIIIRHKYSDEYEYTFFSAS